jgi:hypothetical protein
MKGLGAIFFVLMAGLLVIVSIWLFFVFFKVHVVGISIDVDSINRYQEVPTMLLTSTLFDGKSGSCSNVANEGLCRKGVAFHYMRSKVTGGDVLPENDDSKIFLNDFKVSLPLYCYMIGVRDGDGEKVFLDGKSELRSFRTRGVSSINCNLNQPKISEVYPIPTFVGGVPSVASQTLLIGSSTTTTDNSIFTWPIYSVEFRFGGG